MLVIKNCYISPVIQICTSVNCTLENVGRVTSFIIYCLMDLSGLILFTRQFQILITNNLIFTTERNLTKPRKLLNPELSNETFKGVTTQTKALDDYFLMVVFTLLLHRVKVFSNLIFYLNREPQQLIKNKLLLCGTVWRIWQMISCWG